MPVTRRNLLVGSTVSLAAATMTGGDGMILPTSLAAAEAELAGEALLTLGYRTPGDGGGALYRRVSNEPPHPGKVQAAGGGWFELAEPVVCPEMFGAYGDGRDDRAALQAVLEFAVLRRGRLALVSPHYAFAGELLVPAGARDFVIEGEGRCRLEQLSDDCSHFYFAGEGTSGWAIRNIVFAWTRNQGADRPLSYAIRFDTRTDRNYGHYNFEVADCDFDNGWRGIGVTPEPYRGLRCPVWGATLRRLTCSERHGGALLYLTGYGKTGLPNIALEHIYIRGDAMTEPALRLDSCDMVEMRGIEFNRTRGPGLAFRYGCSLVVTGIRFEQSTLAQATDALILVQGSISRARIQTLTIQNCAGPAGAAAVRADAGAHVTLADPYVVIEPATLRQIGAAVGGRSPAVAASGTGGTVTIDGIGHCAKPGATLAPPGDTGVALAAAEVIRAAIPPGGGRVTVAQPGLVMDRRIEGGAAPGARVGLVVERGGTSITLPFETAPHGLRAEDGIPVAPGDVLAVTSTGAGPLAVVIVIVRA